jgi:GntR family transcriptional regulator
MNDLLNPIVDFAQARAPIYVQLSTLFRRFIVTGQWPVEKQVPTHEALASQFAVNQATVRKAIAMLEEEGLVQRFRRRGTFVVARPQVTEWFPLPGSWADALQAFDGCEIQVLSAREIKDIPAPFHGRGTAAPVYRHMRRIYRHDDCPFILEEIYLDKALETKIGPAKARRVPLLAPIDAATRIERVDQTIRFGIADGEISAALDVPLNAPIAIVYWSVLGPRSVRLYEATSYFRGDAVRLQEPIHFARKGRPT